MADGYRYVDNQVYNDVRKRSNEAKIRMNMSDAALENAQIRLHNVLKEIEGRSDLEAAELSKRIRDEGERILQEVGVIKEQIQSEIDVQNGLLRKEMDSLRKELSETNSNIDVLHHRIHQMTAQFNARLQKLFDQIGQQEYRAGIYVQQLADILFEIDGLHPDKLTPGRAEVLRDALTFARTDMDNGDYQAAIGLAQENIVEALSLQAELEALNGEYDRLCVQLQEAFLAVQTLLVSLSDFDANSEFRRIVIGYNSLEYSYNGDIDHWSNGLFFRLCDAYYEEYDRINRVYIPEMDLENMRAALLSIPGYTDRIEECRKYADGVFRTSCRVLGSADRINRILTKENNLELLTAGFDGEDDRRAYSLVYGDGNGNRIIVVVIPDQALSNPGSGGEARFTVDACDGDSITDPGRCRVVRDAAIARIGAGGVDTGGLKKRQDGYFEGKESQSFIDSGYANGREIRNNGLQEMRGILRI